MPSSEDIFGRILIQEDDIFGQVSLAYDFLSYVTVQTHVLAGMFVSSTAGTKYLSNTFGKDCECGLIEIEGLLAPLFQFLIDVHNCDVTVGEVAYGELS